MRHKCGTACFMVFLIFCLLLYFAELALQLWVAVGLYGENLLVWFVLLLGFIIVPLLTSQLLSCQWAWPEKDATSQCLTILPHLFCAALPWRYCRLILTRGALDTKKELSQVCRLRVFHAFSSSLPILLLETYLLLNNQPGEITNQYVLYTTIGVTLLAVCWSLATHRKSSKDYQFLATLISWPGTVFRITWRFGELTARLIILALFAGLHSFWILLVLALHWLSMFTWALTESIIQAGAAGLTAKSLKQALLSSYVHIFCYLNTHHQKARVRFVLFYVMMCLENVVLLVLWFLYDTRIYLHVPLAIVIGISYVFAFISAILYYNCFHVKSAQVVQRGAEVKYMQPCMNCHPHCCRDKKTSVPQAQQGGFHPAWWIEVKENTETNPNTYDMLLPSELKRNGTEKQSMQMVNHKQHSEPRYWKDVHIKGCNMQTEVTSAMYETLSQYQKQFGHAKGIQLPQRTTKASLHSQEGNANEGFTWDSFNMQLAHGHSEACLNHNCQGQCLGMLRYLYNPHQISDSGISGATTNTTSSSDQSRLRSDNSLLYTSDTSDFTSTQTSLSYLDPLRIHHLSVLGGEDDWSLTSSSFGHNSLLGSPRGDLSHSMYLPMLTHLNNMATSGQLQQHLGHRSPAPLPTEAANTDSRPEVGNGPTPDVHYDHVPSNLSQTSRGGRRARIKMGRAGYRTHGRTSRRTSNRVNLNRKAVPCGVAGKLHKRRHSDTSDIRSRSSIAASTTDSYDGSLSDWDPFSDRASSVQLPGTQSDLDFSVCGEYPFTETENEYVAPTSHPHLSQLPQIVQKLDESGNQIGFVC